MNTRRDFLMGFGGVGALACGRLFGAAVPRSGTSTGVDDELTLFLSDIHLQTHPDRAYAFTAPLFARRVDEILALNPRPRRIIVLGDLVFDHGELESYRFLSEKIAPLQAAGIEVILGMGNHDRRRNFLSVFPEYEAKSPVKGRIVRKVDLNHADFLLLDSLMGNEGPVGAELGAAQEEWLAGEIAAAKRPFFVGAHHPIGKITFHGRPLFEALRASRFFVGWFNGHEHIWQKENLFWGGGGNEDVVRSIMVPTGCAWGEIGYVTLRTGKTEALARVRMLDFVWHDALKAGEARPRSFDVLVEDTDGERTRFVYERPMRNLKRK